MTFSMLPLLVKGGQMKRAVVKEWMDAALEGRLEDTEIAAVLSVLSFRGESEEELAGTLDSLKEHLVPFPVPEGMAGDLFDTCGTGGDGSGSFNISTTVSFLLAGAGIPVVKHGNRAISSRSGSADVLEALGIRIDVDPNTASTLLCRQGLTFLWAPLYHPALKVLAPLRKRLGIRTIFNLVAPLANPARIRRQIVGVSSLSMLPKVASVLGLMGKTSFCVLHGDGLDEATLGGPTSLVRYQEGKCEEMILHPSDFGLPFVPLEKIRGGSAADNAEILRKVLNGTEGPFLDVTLANAALGLWTWGKVSSPRDGVEMAREVLYSRKPLEILDSWVEASKTTPS
ncbi:Anthranilate phosphoribosyltransferase [Leptospirillum ferriphilum]|jgi:anthranilate phosphoribosyltransferase|uniref:Anthranilate phosphoribosyltransferase n=3 Tax=Leptospirillum TaxID=179 RepID=A0A094WA39_9BACT|nr:anthranilate phosphoribosyltransferase [Leptospirillum ferriphilum]AFS54145.1 anthranilate phosphoribosyltransferase [Leptospirillum ferriphilum ML-04]EDZ38026.1 MAG: Anthranilate phosphoribosyltransferase [Leptospirillum sp. Group II '5-way CG']KGA93390.1 Anthranilate phosphoribosyltransferase [Leptospirillum ferriphilum]